jgi:hypothetical protein
MSLALFLLIKRLARKGRSARSRLNLVEDEGGERRGVLYPAADDERSVFPKSKKRDERFRPRCPSLVSIRVSIGGGGGGGGVAAGGRSGERKG